MDNTIKSARLSILLKMKQAGLTNREVAKEAGLTDGRVSQILKTNGRSLSLDRIFQIDQAVNRLIKQRIKQLNSVKL